MRRQRVFDKKAPATGRTPFWLCLADDKQGFEVIPERVTIIRNVFEMVVSGTGQRKIAAIFKSEFARNNENPLIILSEDCRNL